MRVGEEGTTLLMPSLLLFSFHSLHPLLTFLQVITNYLNFSFYMLPGSSQHSKHPGEADLGRDPTGGGELSCIVFCLLKMLYF